MRCILLLLVLLLCLLGFYAQCYRPLLLPLVLLPQRILPLLLRQLFLVLYCLLPVTLLCQPCLSTLLC
jgi:hypothetical protein